MNKQEMPQPLKRRVGYISNTQPSYALIKIPDEIVSKEDYKLGYKNGQIAVLNFVEKTLNQTTQNEQKTDKPIIVPDNVTSEDDYKKGYIDAYTQHIMGITHKYDKAQKERNTHE